MKSVVDILYTWGTPEDHLMEKAAGGGGEGVGQVDVTGPGQSGGN